LLAVSADQAHVRLQSTHRPRRHEPRSREALLGGLDLGATMRICNALTDCAWLAAGQNSSLRSNSPPHVEGLADQ